MTVEFEQTGPIKGDLKFTIDRKTVEKGLDTAFNKAKGTLNVPGFRKGRVPLKMFNQIFG